MLTVSVDSDRCQGHARCLAFAPDFFEFDNEGYSFVPADKQESGELPESVRFAVANCPERAILVSEEPAT